MFTQTPTFIYYALFELSTVHQNISQFFLKLQFIRHCTWIQLFILHTLYQKLMHSIGELVKKSSAEYLGKENVVSPLKIYLICYQKANNLQNEYILIMNVLSLFL